MRFRKDYVPREDALRRKAWPNLAIVSAYNDMLSAHRPYEGFPSPIRQAARAAGATVQVAGGVPAMCDGVTQGEPGMELAIASREVIAMSTAVALSHNMFDAALMLGICDSLGLVRLAAELERAVPGLRIHDADVTADNLGSVDRILRFLAQSH